MARAELASLNFWADRIQGGRQVLEYNGATLFQRDHPRADWDQAMTFARDEGTRQAAASGAMTREHAEAVINFMEHNPGGSIQNAVVRTLSAAGSDFPNANPTPANTGLSSVDVKPVSANHRPLLDGSGISTSEERFAAAKKSAAKEDALRKLWEQISARSREIGSGPRVLTRMLEYFASHQEDGWQQAIEAVEDDETFSRAAEIMRENPNLRWEEVQKRARQSA
jgi:hypothetical protein